MATVKLALEVEQEIQRRIQSAAEERGEHVGEWFRRAIVRELAVERTHDDDTGLALPPPGVKPRGLWDDAAMLHGDETVADAVIEDRR